MAEEGGRVVGHAVASLVADVAELQRIAVAGEHRRAGVATALLDEVLVLAAAAGADRLLLEVRADNAAALAFYAARGFVEVDRRPPLLPRRRHRSGAEADHRPRLRRHRLSRRYPDPYDFDQAGRRK